MLGGLPRPWAPLPPTSLSDPKTLGLLPTTGPQNP